MGWLVMLLLLAGIPDVKPLEAAVFTQGLPRESKIEIGIAVLPEDFLAILGIGNNRFDEVDVFLHPKRNGTEIGSEHDPIDPAHLDCSLHAYWIEPHRVDEDV